MFREMRRKNQEIPHQEALEILENSSSGVLAVMGDEGYPYTVPLSYAFADGKLYFHCATAGHKLDAIRRCGKASFCVIQKDEIVAEKFTTFYRSVVAFGQVRELSPAEMTAAMEKIAGKYSPHEPREKFNEEMQSSVDHLCVLEFNVEHLTGKEAKELMMNRGKR